ncbi:unnamed protein product [Medioppia subpectinata]|uniref:peptidylprolyl isomerase n=1 Tax=Medioppia subpectinata TaxID=1979941 RepID=A0A7R9KHY9_9ACAR|nr:unnamed protein product [Medioppia subpectinata]CAG2102672.1 unnamed protein product [Medioppia subpectinata]
MNIKCYLTPNALRLALILCLTQTLVVETMAAEEDTSGSTAADTNSQSVDKKVKKLQIGVKKRADNCDRKSSKGDILHIHYRGTLYETGAEFDSSYKRGQPLTFTLGMGQVIAGWDQGLLGMCAGEKRKLVIPADLAYGAAGAPPTIPANAPLVFEVECVKIENRKAEL